MLRTTSTALKPHRLRGVSELQDRAPEIVREAAQAPVRVTRYGKVIAALVSPDDLALLERAREALERAVWAFAGERGFRDLRAGRVRDLEEFAAEIRARSRRRA